MKKISANRSGKSYNLILNKWKDEVLYFPEITRISDASIEAFAAGSFKVIVASKDGHLAYFTNYYELEMKEILEIEDPKIEKVIKDYWDYCNVMQMKYHMWELDRESREERKRLAALAPKRYVGENHPIPTCEYHLPVNPSAHYISEQTNWFYDDYIKVIENQYDSDDWEF